MKFNVNYQGITFSVEPEYSEDKDCFVFDQAPIYHEDENMYEVLSWEAIEDITLLAMEEADIAGYNTEE